MAATLHTTLSGLLARAPQHEDGPSRLRDADGAPFDGPTCLKEELGKLGRLASASGRLEDHDRVLLEQVQQRFP